MLKENEHVPFVCDDKIPTGLYPYCREVFNAVLNAKIPYGRTHTVLELVTQALKNDTPGEANVALKEDEHISAIQ